MLTSFLLVWLVTQAIGVGLVWLFTVGLGRPVVLQRFPRVAILVPVKGHEFELDEFLARLFEQDYPAFRVIFAVEAADDPAVSAIEKCRALAPDRVTLVVAWNLVDEGQKTTNLRAALAELSSDDEILVLADADIWPERDWLKRLIAPLVEGTADLVSGFPWLVTKDRKLASYALTSMAASVATIPRLPLLNAAWGGSIAIRREKFMALGMAEEWRGTLSEDLQLTNVAQRAGCRIVAPRELLLRTAIRTDGFGDVTAQVRRWYMLVRVHMPATYGLTVAAVSFSAAGWIACLLGALALRLDALAILAAALALLVVRAAGRARLVRRLWGKAGLAENMGYLRLDPLVSPLATVMSAAYGWSALWMTRTTWAGITYDIRGPQEVRVLKRDG